MSKLHVTRVSCNLTLKLRFPFTRIGSVQNCFCHKTQHFGTMKWEKSASTCKQAFTRYRKTLKANEDFLCVVRNINPTPEQWHRFQLRRGVGRKKSLTNVFMTHQFLFKTESQLSCPCTYNYMCRHRRDSLRHYSVHTIFNLIASTSWRTATPHSVSWPNKKNVAKPSSLTCNVSGF